MDDRPKRTFSSLTPDERRELYETDPAKFDELAAAAIRDACTSRSEAQSLSLRQLQWTIEGRLRKQKTPQQKLQEMQAIFYDRLYGSDGLISRLNAACLALAEACQGTAASRSGKPALRAVEKTGTASTSAKS